MSLYKNISESDEWFLGERVTNKHVHNFSMKLILYCILKKEEMLIIHFNVISVRII